MPKQLVLYILLLVVATQVTAQHSVKSNIQQYTTDNGLPSNGIKGMQWDEQAEFLWLATEAGIVRFNGVDFKSYTKQNIPLLASERMLFMVKNNAGDIYTADQSGNIFRIEKSNPVHWKHDPPAGSARDLGHYYFLNISDQFFNKKINTTADYAYSLGATRFINISDTAVLILRAPHLIYLSISMKNADTLFLDNSAFINAFKINEKIFVVNGKKEILALHIDQHIPAKSSVSPVAGSFLNTKASNLIWQPGMENPFFISGNKAWLVSYNGHAVDTSLICDNIPEDTYFSWVQYSKKNKLFFIGTESKGLIVINRNRVISKKRNYLSKSRNSYYSQIELADGNILTNEADIIGDNLNISGGPGIKGKFGFNLSYTDENTIWLTQNLPPKNSGYLHRFDKLTGITTAYEKIPGEYLVTGSSGNIYLLNFNGIGMLKGDTMSWVYRFKKILPLGVAFDFKEIKPGLLGIASCAGLLTYNISTKVLDTVFTQENMCVRSIWKYKDYVFFGTYGAGFYIYKNGVVKAMPLDKNKYLLYTHCFIPDDDGFCWISTNRGLFKASLAEIINAFENNGSTVYYHYFGKKDGMEMTELNGGCTPCALQMKNKTISFPSMDGLLWVDPAKATPILPAGEIFIDEILVNNVAINADSISLKKLSSKTHELVIKLGFSAWCNKENIYLDYQLNDKNNWIPINTDNDALIRLNGLSSGDYVLRIRKLNGFGINNYSYKEIRFSISTPWHKQWWFYLLCLLALLGVTQIFFNIRTRQYKIRQRKLENQVAEKTRELQEQNEVLEKNNNIKTRLISIISHDIVTPLKFVTVAGKNLIEKRNLMSEDLQNETIREMVNTSQELQLLSTNILNWIKYQNENRRLAKEMFNVHELVNQVFGVLNSLANQKNLKLVNNVDKALEIRQYFEPLKILIYNLLTNAINFSEKGSIVVSTQPGDEVVTISVRDEGAGMTQDQIKNIRADQFIVSSANIDNRKGNGLGYLIIKDLIKMMDASLQIDSEKGKGTTVWVYLR